MGLQRVGHDWVIEQLRFVKLTYDVCGEVTRSFNLAKSYRLSDKENVLSFENNLFSISRVIFFISSPAIFGIVLEFTYIQTCVSPKLIFIKKTKHKFP